MIFELEPVFNNIGFKIDINYEVDFSKVEYDCLYPFTEPVKVTGQIVNEAGVVYVRANARFTFNGECNRCAVSLKKEMIAPIDHVLVTELNDETNDELILLESFRFDMDELVSADIFLMLPSKILCRDDCKGICPYCGQSLNDGPCSCKKPVDPRLEALKQLLDNGNQ